MTAGLEGPERFAGHRYPQVLPVPDHVVPGNLAPWAHVDPQQRRGLDLSLVEQRLRLAERHLDVAALPGEPEEMIALATARHRPVTRRSAVLVALFEDEGETHVVLTRRAYTLRNHRGEVALPGGLSEANEDPVATALREAREEVGLDERSVAVVGWLSPLVSVASNSAIWPVIGLLGGRPNLVGDPAEVDRVFTVALADLVAEGSFLEERWRRAHRRPGVDEAGYFPMYFYRVPGDLIWGATARVLTELLCGVLRVEWPDAHRVWGQVSPVD